MKKRITLKQIAKELNYSISTVSKALKNSPEIGIDAKTKIQAYAKLYNYKPNNVALSLKNRKTKTIGVIIPEMVHYFFAKVIIGIEKFAKKKGYNVIISLSNESFEKEVINIETLVDGQIDGLIISLSKETLLKQDFHHIHETIDLDIPIILFDRISSNVYCDKVIIDDIEGAKKATNHLIKNGRKSILLITTEDYVSVGNLRTSGYIQALKENNIELDTDLIIKVEDKKSTEEELHNIEERINEVLKLKSNIDGIFAVNEIYAASALKVLKKNNIKIPEEVGVIGFTDGVISRFSDPSLTTVDQHGEKIGKQACKLLIERLNNTNNIPYQTKIIETSITSRQSSK
jgi:LacI family transcriptional regulator